MTSYTLSRLSDQTIGDCEQSLTMSLESDQRGWRGAIFRLRRAFAALHSWHRTRIIDDDKVRCGLRALVGTGKPHVVRTVDRVIEIDQCTGKTCRIVATIEVIVRVRDDQIRIVRPFETDPQERPAPAGVKVDAQCGRNVGVTH